LLPRMIELSELRDRTDAGRQAARLHGCNQRQVLEEIQGRLRVAPSPGTEIWALSGGASVAGRPKIYQKFAEWFCRPLKRESRRDRLRAGRLPHPPTTAPQRPCAVSTRLTLTARIRWKPLGMAVTSHSKWPRSGYHADVFRDPIAGPAGCARLLCQIEALVKCDSRCLSTEAQ